MFVVVYLCLFCLASVIFFPKTFKFTKKTLELHIKSDVYIAKYL